MDDVFKIQDEIAGDVVRELKLKLLAAAPRVRTTDPKAYALYLQAKELARQFTPEAFAKSDALPAGTRDRSALRSGVPMSCADSEHGGSKLVQYSQPRGTAACALA